MKRDTKTAEAAPAKVGDNWVNILRSVDPAWKKIAVSPAHGETKWFDTYEEALQHAATLGLPIRRDECKPAPAQSGQHTLDLTAREKKLILRNGLLRQDKADLLEALRQVLQDDARFPEAKSNLRPVTRDKARAAIAKAERG